MSSTGSRSSKRAKTYTRYDPLSGRKVKVPETDPRFDEWPSRKPSKKSKREALIQEAAGGVGLSKEAAKAVGAVGTALAPTIARQIPKVIRAATKAQVNTGALSSILGTGVVTLGTSGAAALIAAGLGSYFTTRYIMERFSQGGRLDAALKALLKARREMSAKLGRELTREELQALNAHYQQVVRDIKARGGS